MYTSRESINATGVCTTASYFASPLLLSFPREAPPVSPLSRAAHRPSPEPGARDPQRETEIPGNCDHRDGGVE